MKISKDWSIFLSEILGGIKYSSFDLEDKEWVGENNARQGGNGTKSSPIRNSKLGRKKKKKGRGEDFYFYLLTLVLKMFSCLSDASTLLSKIN